MGLLLNNSSSASLDILWLLCKTLAGCVGRRAHVQLRGTISPGNWSHAGYDCKKKEKVVLLQRSIVKLSVSYIGG
jgi:hypothetical protein